MAKNRFQRVKGTKDFLVMTVVFTFLCLWSIRDAWFPTDRILKKHPLEFPVTVAVSGVVTEIPVEVGDEVSGALPLVKLGTRSYKEAAAVAEEEYRAAKDGDPAVLKEKLDALLAAKEDLRATTVTCKDFTLETTHGEEALHGRVLEVFAAPATEVEAGDTVMLIRPKDTFYMFNKTLAVISFIAAIVFLFFHRVASK